MYLRLVLFILCLGLSGCDQQEPFEARLQVGTNLWPGYEPLYLADSLGYLEGSEIRVVLLPSASEVMRSFRNGVLDVAAVTLDEAMQLAASGVRLKIFLVTDISAGGDVILARPPVSDLAGLAGKRVGLESTAMGAFLLSRAMQMANLTADQLELIDLQVDQHEAAFINGEVDAVVTFEPVRTRLLNQGAISVFDSSQIPDEIVDVLVVRESVMSQRQGQLQALVEAWFRVVDLMREQPEKANQLASKHQGLSLEDMRTAFHGLEIPSRQRVKRLLSASGLGKNSVPIQEWMQSRHLLAEDAVPVRQLLYPDYL